MKRTQLARILKENFSKVVSKKDGTFDIRESFYYKFGRTCKTHEEKITAELEALGILDQVTVSGRYEKWQAWPKDSWFGVIVSLRPTA